MKHKILLFICMITALLQTYASVAELMYNTFQSVGKYLYVYGGGWNTTNAPQGNTVGYL